LWAGRRSWSARRGIRGTPLAIGHHITGLALLFQGRPVQAAARLEQALATPGWAVSEPWLGASAETWRCHALLLAGRFADAAAAAEAAYQHTLETGWHLALVQALIERAQVCRACGQLQQSLRWLREGLGLARDAHSVGKLFTSVILAELAHGAALLGDHATAQRMLTESDATRLSAGAIFRPWADLARPWVTAAAGEPAAAARQALGAVPYGDQLAVRRDAEDLDLADSYMCDELCVPPNDRPDGFGRGRRIMSLALDGDRGLIEHFPLDDRRFEVAGAVSGCDSRLEVRPAVVVQGRIGTGGHAGGDLELAQSLARRFGLWPSCCQQRLDRVSEPDRASGELGVRGWELVPLAPLSDEAWGSV
jgi:hypothetical protein